MSSEGIAIVKSVFYEHVHEGSCCFCVTVSSVTCSHFSFVIRALPGSVGVTHCRFLSIVLPHQSCAKRVWKLLRIAHITLLKFQAACLMK